MPKEKKENEKNKLHKLQDELEQAKQAQLRAVADYANLERRVSEERLAMGERASHELLKKLFPVFDNLYRSTAHLPQMSEKPTDEEIAKLLTYLEGVKMIESQLETILSDAGLKKIQTNGEQFDHNLHEAISYEKNSEIPEDHVIAEVEAGWMLGDSVLKPAKVRVSKG